MKSKQSLLQQIIAVSSKKARDNLKGQALNQFEEKIKLVPIKMKQLDSTPYMFIFDALVNIKQCVDFTFTQYQTMIEQNFLNADNHSKNLTSQFRRNLEQHSFLIIQIIMKIKTPNLDFLQLFFQIQRSVAMPDNVLENFKYVGYGWLSRCFSFRKCPRPAYIDQITMGIIQSQMRNLPSLEQSHKSIQKYIGKILQNMVLKVQENILIENKQIQKKYRYGYCFMCQKGADYYCKDTKIPVCSSQCKKSHINYISNHPSIDYQYSTTIQRKFQNLLINNLLAKNNIALTVDYLCSIYTNSEYQPFHDLPHRQLLSSPIIIERVWLLYLTYYQRKGQIFEHIFADCLKSTNEYVRINAGKYFLKIAETNRILQVYSSLDFKGFRRIFPVIIDNLDPQNSLKFITSLVSNTFNSKINFTKIQYNPDTSKSTLLRKINNDKNPIASFSDLKQHSDNIQSEHAIREMMRFIIKNEEQINKSKVCDLIIKQKKGTLIFFEELLLSKQEGNTIKNYKLIDQILRQIFYFVNIKVSDKIYNFLEILWEIINPKIQPPHFPELSQKFSSENTSTQDTLFQFIYLILMIITEQNNLDKSNKSTFDDFLKRIKHFDPKFCEKQRNYISQVYDRIISLPFSQITRGILTNYPIVKNIGIQNFNPKIMIVENWQIIYESIMGLNCDTTFLYRICCILIDFPHLSNSFMQLLLNKMDVNNIQQHLIPSINGILQEDPNCVGSSWSQIFYRNPETHSFLFDLSALIHYSKSLNTQSFIWFSRQFCKNINLADNMDECEKLLNYNYSSMNMFKSQENREQECIFEERVNILNREMIQLFNHEQNIYYQIMFIKRIFIIGDLDLAAILIDILPINMVTTSLIMCSLTEIVKKHHKYLNQYRPRKNSKISADNIEQKQSKIWGHIINKVLLISQSNMFSSESNQYFVVFSQTLKNLPQCYRYFRSLNIQRALAISHLQRSLHQNQIAFAQIHKQLKNELNSFIQYIPQMNDDILEQFVCLENIQAIVSHFSYFCHLDSVYNVLADYKNSNIVEWQFKIKKVVQGIQKYNNDENKSKKIQINKLINYSSFLFVCLCQLQTSHPLFSKFMQELQKLMRQNLQQLQTMTYLQQKQEIEQSIPYDFYQISRKIYRLIAKINKSISDCLLSKNNQKITHFNLLFNGNADFKSRIKIFIEQFYSSTMIINNSIQFRNKLWKHQLFTQLPIPPGLLQHYNMIVLTLININSLYVVQINDDDLMGLESYANILYWIDSVLKKCIKNFKQLKILLLQQGSQKKKKKNTKSESLRQDMNKILIYLKNKQTNYDNKLIVQLKKLLIFLKQYVHHRRNGQQVCNRIQNKINDIGKQIVSLMDTGFSIYMPQSLDFIFKKQNTNQPCLLLQIYQMLNQF